MGTVVVPMTNQGYPVKVGKTLYVKNRKEWRSCAREARQLGHRDLADLTIRGER